MPQKANAWRGVVSGPVAQVLVLGHFFRHLVWANATLCPLCNAAGVWVHAPIPSSRMDTHEPRSTLLPYSLLAL